MDVRYFDQNRKFVDIHQINTININRYGEINKAKKSKKEKLYSLYDNIVNDKQQFTQPELRHFALTCKHLRLFKLLESYFNYLHRTTKKSISEILSTYDDDTLLIIFESTHSANESMLVISLYENLKLRQLKLSGKQLLSLLKSCYISKNNQMISELFEVLRSVGDEAHITQEMYYLFFSTFIRQGNYQSALQSLRYINPPFQFTALSHLLFNPAIYTSISAISKSYNDLQSNYEKLILQEIHRTFHPTFAKVASLRLGFKFYKKFTILRYASQLPTDQPLHSFDLAIRLAASNPRVELSVRQVEDLLDNPDFTSPQSLCQHSLLMLLYYAKSSTEIANRIFKLAFTQTKLSYSFIFSFARCYAKFADARLYLSLLLHIRVFKKLKIIHLRKLMLNLQQCNYYENFFDDFLFTLSEYIDPPQIRSAFQASLKPNAFYDQSDFFVSLQHEAQIDFRSESWDFSMYIDEMDADDSKSFNLFSLTSPQFGDNNYNNNNHHNNKHKRTNTSSFDDEEEDTVDDNRLIAKVVFRNALVIMLHLRKDERQIWKLCEYFYERIEPQIFDAKMNQLIRTYMKLDGDQKYPLCVMTPSRSLRTMSEVVELLEEIRSFYASKEKKQK